jgi:pimeloyl-ACP methyl ester carboxylesterase
MGTSTFSTGGATIHYRDEGRGLPLLLLHAFPLSSKTYDPQIAALSSKYRIIAPDHRGFGKSTPPGVGATEMKQIALDAIALLDHLEIPHAVVGGVSMGGYATMAFLRESPARARGIILIDTQMGADDEAGKAKREELAKATETRGLDPVVEAFLPRLLSPNATAAMKAAVEAEMRANTPAGVAAGLRGLALRPDSSEVLKNHSGRALVIVGEADPITTPEKAQQMVDVLSRAQLLKIPNAGHLANVEAPEKVNAAIDGFLAEIEKEG